MINGNVARTFLFKEQFQIIIIHLMIWSKTLRTSNDQNKTQA